MTKKKAETEVDDQRDSAAERIRKISFFKKEGAEIQPRDPRAAIDSFLKALVISREESLAAETTAILTDLAICHTSLSNYEKSIELLAEARNICIEHNLTDLLTKIRNNLGINYYYLGKYNVACEIFEAILAEQLRQGDISATRIVLVNLTNVYQHLGDFSKALECSFKSLELSLEIGDEYRVGLNYGNLGMIYIELGEWDKAEDFLLKSLEIRRKRKDIAGEARILNNLSKISQNKGDIAQAFEYASVSVTLRDKAGDRSGMAKTILSLGELHQISGNSEMAISCFSRALEIASDCSDIYTQSIALKSLGMTHYAAGEYDAAISCYEKAEEKALSIGDKNILIEITTNLAECFAAAECWQQAYEKQLLLKELEDEIKTTEKQKAIAEMQSFYEADTARRESEVLKQKNTELAALNEKLEELTIEKDNIIGTVAHELKNPLQGLHLVASLLERYSERLNHEEVRINAARSLKTIDHMSAIIKNLLDIHAIESGNIDVVWAPLDPAEIIHALLNDYNPQLTKKGISISFKKPDNQVLMTTDKLLLRQVFENLLSNAVKFSPAEKQIFIDLKAGDGVITCSVQDEGPGLTQDDMSKLFGKFTKLSARPTGGETSTGLGLSIVKKLTETLKGNVHCTSTAGEGATFTVQFPVV
ncbi:MAG: tetratricopeptide repeat-containing sensor histidine kinase [Bacteroidota bacterium]